MAGSTGANIFDMTYKAYGDMRSNQFYCVEVQAAGVVQICSAVTAVACGIIQDNPNSGDTCTVRHEGKSKYKLNGSVTAGARIGAAANGALASKTEGTNTTHYVIAQDVNGGSSGDIGVCLVRGTPVRAA